PVLIQMLSIGEETGQLENISNQMSEFYEHEADIYLNRMVSMIEPIMIILVGIIALFLVICVFLPMLSIYDVIYEGRVINDKTLYILLWIFIIYSRRFI